MPTSHTIHLGADHGGYQLKDAIKDHLLATGHTVFDHGVDGPASVDYPLFAQAVCGNVRLGSALGILICGTGQGMAMTANKQPGIRAALCTDEFTARMSRQHNDANVLCLGGRVLGQGLALSIVDAFLASEFEGGRHLRRVQLMEPRA